MTAQSPTWDRLTPTDTRQPEAFTATFDQLEPTVWDGQIVPGEVVATSVEDRPRRVSRIEVRRGGTIELRDDTTVGRETMAEVTSDTFYTHIRSVLTNSGRTADRVSLLTYRTLMVDLDAIAAAARAAQQNGGQAPDPSKRIFVGREGEVRLGDEATGSDRVAEVTGDTFYAPSRVGDETAFARSHMPRNTIRVSDGTYDGWHFTITNEFGDSYSLFLYYHPSYAVYRVAIVSPQMQGTVDAHGTHLWSDGTLCLTRASGSGYRSMASTYAKAALWTRGASCYRRGYGFQFNVGQD